ncbi:hypothetical protein BLA29_014554, partial [Euroglyphus maynei]
IRCLCLHSTVVYSLKVTLFTVNNFFIEQFSSVVILEAGGGWKDLGYGKKNCFSPSHCILPVYTRMGKSIFLK